MHAAAFSTNSHLIAASQQRPGDDPIFALNAEAARRAQAGERVLNATLGALMEDDGRLAVLPTVFEALARVPAERAAAYAPIAGQPRFLAAVVADLFGSTALAQQAVAVATPGGTGALHHAIVNFLDAGQALLAPSYYWGPYETLANHTRRAVATFAMFDARGRFDLEALAAALQRQLAEQGRALLILNTPCNNPTGYSLDAQEWSQLARVLREAAALGPVSLLVDYAYAAFAPPGGAPWQAEVAALAGSVQVLVAWTASKSFAQYGARVGALVALHPRADERARLSSALAYSCRGTWSNCNHLGMLAIAELLEDPQLRARCESERGRLRALLAGRVAAFNEHAKRAGLRYPRYEGGFFVCVFARDAERSARTLRERGVYVVPQAGALRIALCSTPAAEAERLVAELARALD